jgi:hypothetical protein
VPGTKATAASIAARKARLVVIDQLSLFLWRLGTPQRSMPADPEMRLPRNGRLGNVVILAI